MSKRTSLGSAATKRVRERRGGNLLPRKEHVPYLIVFLIPLLVRAVPELEYTYPIGFDTPLYMYGMKYSLSGVYQQTNAFWLMLRGLGSAGVDASLFFKVYPPVIFALTCVILAVYAHRSFQWNAKSLIVFSTVYSLTPALLRISYDGQRAMFALFLLAAALVAEKANFRDRIKWPFVILLYAGIAFTHEFIFAVGAAVLVLKSVRVFWKKKTQRDFLAPLLGILVIVVVYALVRLQVAEGLVNAVFTFNYSPQGIIFSDSWQRFDWWLSLALLAYGLLLPLAMLGFFRDRTMLSWTLVTTIPFFSFVISYFSFSQPERYLYLAGIPLTFYVANFVRKIDSRKLAFYGVLALMSIQPLSMIGAMPLPLSIYADKRYGTFTDALNPSLPQEQLGALQIFANKVNGLKEAPSSLLVSNVLALDWWARYFFPKMNVYMAGEPVFQQTLQSNQTSLLILSMGMVLPTNRTSLLLSSYGGLNLYLIR